MLSRDKRSLHGFDWPAIVKTLSVEIVVLLALAGAFVGYLDWSSKVNVREFMAASRSPGADPDHRPRSPISLQVIKRQTGSDLEI